MDIPANAYDGIERRKYPRINAAIRYTVLDDVSEVPLSTKNISAGGIAFFAREHIAPDTRLSLAMTLPDSSAYTVTVRVVWSAPVRISSDESLRFELGVEFLSISEDERKKIARYVFLRLDND